MDSLLLDSITDADTLARGRVVVCGSHGGMYPAAIASGAGVRAAVFNDAGEGLERAGVAGVLALEGIGMAAAAVDRNSCHIGSARDTLARGEISVANDIAAALGVMPGMPVRQAVALLQDAPVPVGRLQPVRESRQEYKFGSGGFLHLLDSASLVGPQDTGKIVITGSHGGLIGGNPKRAIKANARIAVFNDAGIGADDIGISRLPALNARGVAAVTVACQTARIGDALSALETGVVSARNDLAQALGAQVGRGLSDWLLGVE
jgi:hypothetical protein